MMGVVSLLTAAGSPLIKVGLAVLGVVVLLTGIARLADLRDDEL